MLSFGKIVSLVIVLSVFIFLLIVLRSRVHHDDKNEKFEVDERSDASFRMAVLNAIDSVRSSSDRTMEVSNTTNSTTVNLTIYYESECPFSTKFFIGQLSPNYKNFSPYMKLDFVPSGSSRYKKMANGTYKFRCQHGPLECEENKLQVCAIDKLSKLSSSLVDEFIICYQSMWDKNPKDCAEKYSIDFGSIQSCADSIEGDELRVKFVDRTNNYQPDIPSVPFIMVNDVFDLSVNREFKIDLAEAVCKRLNYTPDICSSQFTTELFSTTEPEEEQ